MTTEQRIRLAKAMGITVKPSGIYFVAVRSESDSDIVSHGDVWLTHAQDSEADAWEYCFPWDDLNAIRLVEISLPPKLRREYEREVFDLLRQKSPFGAFDDWRPDDIDLMTLDAPTRCAELLKVLEERP